MTRRQRIILSALLSAGVFAVAAPVGAFTLVHGPWRLPVRWSLAEVSSDLGASGTRELIDRAIADWAAFDCTDLVAEYEGTTGSPPDAADDQNVVGWIESNWPHSSATIGRTTFRSSSTSAESDIAFNGDDYQWVRGAPQNRQEVDAYSIILHEFGHFFGIGHSQSPDSAMVARYSGGVSSLADDDRDAICELYPRDPGSPPPNPPPDTPPPDPPPPDPPPGDDDSPMPNRPTSRPVDGATSSGQPEEGELGAPCRTNDDCTFGGCAERGTQTFCTMLCDSDSICGSNMRCDPAGDFDICVPMFSAASNASDLRGTVCTVAHGRPLRLTSLPFGLAAAVVWLGWRRRRR